MRAIVVKVVYPNNTVGAEDALNRIGSVTEKNITCSNFTLDVSRDHYISNLIILYTKSVINKVIITSNNGTKLSRG